MPGQYSISDVMDKLTTIHGDVKVALDRTDSQGKELSVMKTEQIHQGQEIARAKGHATALGAIASVVVVAVIEWIKSAAGGHPTS